MSVSASMPVAVDRSGPARAGAAAWLALAVLVLATIVGAVDRQLLVLMAEPLKHSLHLSDTQLGLLQGAGVTLFAGLAAFPIGWPADRHDRRLVLGGCVLVWSASTAACGLSQSFGHLLLAASGLGLGEAGLIPIVYSLIPDLFPREKRATANAVYALAAVFGAGIGIWSSAALLAWADGFVATATGSLGRLEGWRVAFLVAAALGPLIALAIGLLRLRRAAPEGTDVEGPSSTLLPYLRRHAASLTGIFGAMGLCTLGMTAIATWLPVIAVRHLGASVPDSGKAIGLAFAAGTLAGGAIGAAQARLQRRFGPVVLVRLMWGCIGVAGLVAVAMPVMHDLSGLAGLFAMQVMATFVGSVVYASLIQLITPAAIRSRVLALNATVVALLSAASPIAVGLLSDHLQGSERPLLLAVTVVTVTAMVLGAALLWRFESSVLRSAHEVNA
ncbi:MFS transporter [Mitsuaria sp. 7]|uniref:MFS transporter n=1 Tax=Mitsuaria sp. 7 TaxID=1658665 RepID=UPI00082DCCE7|nr:MFS transporter [Mitsuaria sp. 7]